MQKCFVSGLPDSFYGRLFPTNSLNLVYSSYSLHWLSQVPEGVESNKKNIHMAMTSPKDVFEAYSSQYRKDFTTFLRSRGQEVVSGGCMVLTFVGRSVADPSSKEDCGHVALLANTLLDMVSEGKIKKADSHAFNIPLYTPSEQEVEEMISSEGSFNLDRLEVFRALWDEHVDRGIVDNYVRGELVSNFVRAYTEPMLATHFGNHVMDELYVKYGKKIGEHLSREKPSIFTMVICLSKT